MVNNYEFSPVGPIFSQTLIRSTTNARHHKGNGHLVEYRGFYSLALFRASAAAISS